MHLIDKAMQLALEAYGGKTDLAGRPYIFHPLELMALVDDEAEKLLALLHDYVEECGLSEIDAVAKLKSAGFPAEIIDDLLLLTRRPGESYMRYITRLSSKARTRKIKRLDLSHNMDLRRLPRLTDADLQRQARYHKAWLRLQKAERDDQLQAPIVVTNLGS